MRPNHTLKRILIHSKDKPMPLEGAGVVYQIPCKDFPKVCTGEIGRRFGAREKEHRKDALVMDKNYTRSRKKNSVSVVHSLVCTDHLNRSHRLREGSTPNELGYHDYRLEPTL